MIPCPALQLELCNRSSNFCSVSWPSALGSRLFDKCTHKLMHTFYNLSFSNSTLVNAICSTTVPVGMQLHLSTDSLTCTGLRDGVAGELKKLLLTARVHFSLVQICTCTFVWLFFISSLIMPLAARAHSTL